MLWPFALYFILVMVLVGGILGVSYVLGERSQRNWDRDQPYESGMLPTGSARVRFDIQYYLNAMFFVAFDLETMFIIAWASAYRVVGWAGYVEILIFIVVLVAGLAYLWRLGALDWGPRRAGRGAVDAPGDGTGDGQAADERNS